MCRDIFRLYCDEKDTIYVPKINSIILWKGRWFIMTIAKIFEQELFKSGYNAISDFLGRLTDFTNSIKRDLKNSVLYYFLKNIIYYMI